METVFVSALPYRVTEDTLRDLFVDFGQVGSITIRADWENGSFEPFALVEIDNAAAAIHALDGRYFGLTRLRVNEYIDVERNDAYERH